MELRAGREETWMSVRDPSHQEADAVCSVEAGAPGCARWEDMAPAVHLRKAPACLAAVTRGQSPASLQDSCGRRSQWFPWGSVTGSIGSRLEWMDLFPETLQGGSESAGQGWSSGASTLGSCCCLSPVPAAMCGKSWASSPSPVL